MRIQHSSYPQRAPKSATCTIRLGAADGPVMLTYDCDAGKATPADMTREIKAALVAQLGITEPGWLIHYGVILTEGTRDADVFLSRTILSVEHAGNRIECWWSAREDFS